MSRRVDGSRRYVRAHGGLPPTPPASFAITGVSANVGSIAGGDVITVTATGIFGTPTSTLGVVSAITATTFAITTNSHAAGAFSWTVTNGNGLVSATQTFTYSAWLPASFPNYTAPNGTTPLINWLAIGDSLTAGPTQSPSGPALWTFRCAEQLGSLVSLTNVGQGGETLLSMVAAIPTLNGHFSYAPGVQNICTIQGGINDVTLNQATPGTTTPSTIAASYTSLIAGLQAQGWLVIAWTPEASNIWNNATYGTVDYTTTVGLVRTACLAANATIDIAADAILGPANSYSSLTWYLDNTHKTVNADERKAHVLAMPVMNNILAPSNQAATGNFVYGIYPSAGPTGGSTAVGIRITNLTSGSTITSVTVGGQACTSVSFDYARNTVFATVPSGSASGDVVVVVGGVTASGGAGLWTANAVPLVLSMEPFIMLPAGGTLVIHGDPAGASFSTATAVQTSDGVVASSIVVNSATKITATFGTGGSGLLNPTVAGVTPVDIKVVTSGAGTSDPTLGSKLGVLPTSITFAFVPCSQLYDATSGKLTPLSGVYTPPGQVTAAKRPTLASTTFTGTPGAAPSLSYVSANNQSIGGNSGPAAMTAPYTVGITAAIPAWAAQKGVFGSNTNNSFFTLGYGGLGTLSAYIAGTNSDTMEWASNVHATGWPGGAAFAFVVNGSSSTIHVDGTNTPIVITGTPGATGYGIGIVMGSVAGFPGDMTHGLVWGAASDATADLPAIQWLSSYFYGTAYP